MVETAISKVLHAGILTMEQTALLRGSNLVTRTIIHVELVQDSNPVITTIIQKACVPDLEAETRSITLMVQ